MFRKRRFSTYKEIWEMDKYFQYLEKVLRQLKRVQNYAKPVQATDYKGEPYTKYTGDSDLMYWALDDNAKLIALIEEILDNAEYEYGVMMSTP